MILITRPKIQTLKLSNELRVNNFNFYSEPLTFFYYSTKKIRIIDDCIYLVSSPQCIQYFIKNKSDYFDLKNKCKFIVIGKSVAVELKKLGFKKVTKVVLNSSELVAYIDRQNNIKSINHLCGSIAYDEVEKFFTKYKKVKYIKSIVYYTKLKKKLSKRCMKLINEKKIKTIIFYSLTAVHVFISLTMLQKNLNSFKTMKFLCLSKRVAEGLISIGVKNKNIKIASIPDHRSIMKLLIENRSTIEL